MALQSTIRRYKAKRVSRGRAPNAALAKRCEPRDGGVLAGTDIEVGGLLSRTRRTNREWCKQSSAQVGGIFSDRTLLDRQVGRPCGPCPPTGSLHSPRTPGRVRSGAVESACGKTCITRGAPAAVLGVVSAASMCRTCKRGSSWVHGPAACGHLYGCLEMFFGWLGHPGAGRRQMLVAVLAAHGLPFWIHLIEE